MGLFNFKNFDRNKWLYNGLIVTFIILYAVTAFVSFYHAITFFNIANAIWLSVLLSFVAEIGQASVLFGILLTKNKNKFLPWVIMIILTSLQVIGNVVSSFDWIVAHNDAGLDGFKRSILFFIQTEDSEMFRVIIAWISGALLPIIALSMTALVAQNLQLRDEEKQSQDTSEFTGSTIPQEPIISASDVISEVSKFRPTEEDLENMEKFLKNKTPIIKVPTEEEENSVKSQPVYKDGKIDTSIFKSPGVPIVEKDTDEKKSESGAPFDEPIYNPEPIADFIVPIDDPEESHEPDDEYDAIDLIDKIPDEILPKDIKEISSNIEDKSEDIDILDEDAKQWSPEIIISHTNGLVDGIEDVSSKIQPQTEEKIQEPPEIIEKPPIPTKEHFTSEQLDRIRQIAKDNLKKK